MIQVGPEGTEQWTRHLGTSVPSTQPIILSKGTRVVVTSLGEVWGFGPNGEPKFRKNLDSKGEDPRTSPLARNDGSFVVAVGSSVVAFDSNAEVISKADVAKRVVGSLVEDGDAVLITTETGEVFRWASPLPPKRVGSFQGIALEGGARTRDGRLLAVADMERLMSMDVKSGVTTTLLRSNKLEGPPTIGKDNSTYITTTSGELITLSLEGEEQRVSLIASSTKTPDGGLPAYAPASPPILVDHDGRVAFARTGGRVGVVLPSGQRHFAPKRSCKTPVAIMPAGEKKFVVVCRNGDLRLYGP